MGKFAHVCCLLIFLFACRENGKERTDERLTKQIMAYLQSGTPASAKPAADSVRIHSIDTLTEKNIVKIQLDRNYQTLDGLNSIYASARDLISADSALLVSLQKQADFYRKNNEKFDQSTLSEQVRKMSADVTHLAESISNISRSKSVIDSLTDVYQRADSVKPCAYFISASVFSDGTEQPGNFIITTGMKVIR